MATRQTGTARLSLFSDGVFAVLITILVLEPNRRTPTPSPPC